MSTPHKGKASTGPKSGTKRKPGPSDPRPGKPEAKRHKSEGGSVPASTQPPGPVLSKKERKQQAHEKKAKFKKNYATIHETVLLWEQLRPKTITTADKQALVKRVLHKVKGQVPQLAQHHSASRVIQFCLKHASPEDRQTLFDETRANVVELAKSKYGHHLVQKLITVASKEEVPDLVKAFKGRVAELLRHPQGSEVLTDLYDVASSAQRNAMCAELYGREFSLFDGVATRGEDVKHLRQLLEGADEAKRRAILSSLGRALSPVMEKALLMPPMVHRLLREYLEAAPPLSVEDAVDTLCQTGGSVLKMAHTHDGAAAACMLVAYGSPKDRKRLVRGLKGFVAKTAQNEWGHAVLCGLVSHVDDTAMLNKVVTAELKSELEELVDDKYARRVLLQLLAPDNSRYLTPATLELLHPPQRTIRDAKGSQAAGAGAESDEEVGDDEAAPTHRPADAADADASEAAGAGPGSELQERVLGASKKAPELRRRELLGGGKDGLGAALTRVVAARAGALLRSATGAEVVVEVARGGDGALLWQLQQAGVERVHDAIVRDIVGDVRGDGDGMEGEEAGPAPAAEPLLTNFFSSRALRRLVLASSDEGPGGESARAFVRALWGRALKGRCSSWAGTHGDKVLAAMLHSGDAEVRAAVAAELRSLVKQPLEEWAQKFMGPPQRGKHGAGAQEAAPSKREQQQQQQRQTNGQSSSKQQHKQKPKTAHSQQPEARMADAVAETPHTQKKRRKSAKAS